MSHEAILALNPTVVLIKGEIAYDANGDEVAYDASALAAWDALNDLRKERNSLLAVTDWWASSDLTMTAEQIAYRQALRDITNTYTSLDDVVWPEKP